jgi:hypothetical protein
MNATFFVSPAGNDAWTGTLDAPNASATDGPWRTLARASQSAQPGQTILIRQGVYREILRPANSGTAEHPIVFRNYPSEAVTITGTEPVTNWHSDDAGVTFHAPLPVDLKTGNQLFLEGEPLDQARWPVNQSDDTLFFPTRAIATAGSTNSLTDPALAEPQLPADIDMTGATLWCAGGLKWVCWSARIARHDRSTGTLHYRKTIPNRRHAFYNAKEGNDYAVIGLAKPIAPGQWSIDRTTGRLQLWLPKKRAAVDPNTLTLEAKARLIAVDLSDRSHVHIVGLRVFAGAIVTSPRSSHLTLRNLHARYLGHSYFFDVSQRYSLLLKGSSHRLENCDIGYSSGSVLRVKGDDHRVTNNHLHHGNYAARWNGAVALTGRRILFSHNTVEVSGRDLVTLMQCSQSLLEYNDLSRPGTLTWDLGVTYGHTTDFRGTTLRYNAIHDNLAQGVAMGIYFDHASHNAVVHHNEVWNVSFDPLRVNNPSYFTLVFNNTCFNTGPLGTWDHAGRDDLFGCRFVNNIVNDAIELPAHVVQQPNLRSENPGFTDPANHDFTITTMSTAATGAVALPGLQPASVSPLSNYFGANPPGAARRKVGHDFATPPAIPEVWHLTIAPMSNAIDNACFDHGLESFEASDPQLCTLVKGNFWGVGTGPGKSHEATSTGNHVLRIGPAACSVSQRITGLHPRTGHTFSCWVRVTDVSESVRVSVSAPQMTTRSITTSSTSWTRLEIPFTTPDAAGEIKVTIEKTSPGPGLALVDNLGLPRALPE